MVDEETVNKMYRQVLRRIRAVTRLSANDLSPADAAEIRCYIRYGLSQPEYANACDKLSPHPYYASEIAAEAALQWMEANIGIRVQLSSDESFFICIQKEIFSREGTEGIALYADYFRRKLNERDLL